MSTSYWLNNNKVIFSVVTVDSIKYLVCHSNYGGHKVVYVENLVTSERKFPEKHFIESGQGYDDVVMECIKNFNTQDNPGSSSEPK